MNRPGLKAFGKFDLISIDNEKGKKNKNKNEKNKNKRFDLRNINFKR